MKPYGIIYSATNKVNGKLYIGQTIRPLKSRILDHKKVAKTRNPMRPFINAIRKYGIDGFIFKQIDSCSNQKELDKTEKYWINHLESNKKGYNATSGGEHPIFSNETKRRMRSIPNKGRFKKGHIVQRKTPAKANSGSFKEGHITWNTGTKGLMPTPWNKGKKTGIVPKTGFKKGNLPWSYGTEGLTRHREVICLETSDIFYTLTAASNTYGISVDSIMKACNPKYSRNKSAGGYHWKYVEDLL